MKPIDFKNKKVADDDHVILIEHLTTDELKTILRAVNELKKDRK